jgi:ubiquinone/menaquinone biosynthesis C-methylase UbiE
MEPRIYTQADSKVEIKGGEARHYDLLMNLISGGTYPAFIHQAIKEMNIKPQDRILDLGCGSGRNICLMNHYLSPQGRILGLDIGTEMLEQSRRRCQKYPYISFKNQRIDEPLPYENEFDIVFISFVLHGFIQEKRIRIIENAARALRSGGRFILLDYGEFDLKSSPWLVRWAFKVECALATDFIGRNLQAILLEKGFDDFHIHPHYRGYIRLLSAQKKPDR